MERRPEDSGFYRILLAIETDPTRYYGSNASRPTLLGASESEQMLAHIAADLKSLLPEISNCSLIAAGALFDQTQVLTPSYPVFGALEAVSTNDNAENFKPGLVSIGARDGKMPSDDLQPLPDIPLSLFQLLPVIVHGPADLVEELGQAMEYRFMEEGQVSAHSAAWLETAFGISVNHARMMTLTDLSAMLRMQLDHFGFLPLWELLDAALSERPGPLLIKTQSGREFEWKTAPFTHPTKRSTVGRPAAQGRKLTQYSIHWRQLTGTGHGNFDSTSPRSKRTDSNSVFTVPLTVFLWKGRSS